MNRRQLFKYLGAAVVASTGIALIDTHKTFFLPPSGGWGAQKLKIRVIQQYIINTEPFRYDGTWVKANGEHCQYHIDMLERNDHIAGMILQHRMAADAGTPNSDQFILKLPRGAIMGEYIYA